MGAGKRLGEGKGLREGMGREEKGVTRVRINDGRAKEG